jgi:phosphoglycerol transferase MdoB-like AlkP superfamily enzyme
MTRGTARLTWIAAAFMLVSAATRIGLALFSDSAYTLGEWLRFIAIGTAFDLAVVPCFLVPWAIYDMVMPEFDAHTRRARIERLWAIAWAGAFLSIFLVVGASEFAFWAEFNSRFDFIAVDYLVYTHEVLGNIGESYPLVLWLSVVFIISLVACRLTWPRRPAIVKAGWKRRALHAVGVIVATVAGLGIADVRYAEDSSSGYVTQLSLNGVFAFGHAYQHNELDYEKYYPTLAEDELDGEIRALLAQPHTRYLKNSGFVRQIAPTRTQRRLNVVLISVESLSAEYMARFGNNAGLTPELDRLAREGMSFSRFYATGTRTVRGLEALSVGTPPTPGQSIVRRPNNDDLENLGEELGEHGWSPYWIYGGYGVFDNMNAYFAANHYKVLDRTDLEAEKIPVHHENIWGVADEDLYSLALLNFDRAHATGKPFFAHIMTTSNHRPYTFPENRVDLPQKRREGAVKYSDWAIGDLIRRARAKPWFKDTVFIITGDHTAKAAGKTDLPPSRYHIPLIWYAPAHIAPSRVDRLMSQVDLAPTLLAWLGVGYDSRFFGYDLFSLEPGRERAFISTYQKLGLLKGDRLVVLDVRKPPLVTKGLGGITLPPGQPRQSDKQLVREAIAWYQAASRAFRTNQLKDEEVPVARR